MKKNRRDTVKTKVLKTQQVRPKIYQNETGKHDIKTFPEYLAHVDPASNHLTRCLFSAGDLPVRGLKAAFKAGFKPQKAVVMLLKRTGCWVSWMEQYR